MTAHKGTGSEIKDIMAYLKRARDAEDSRTALKALRICKKMITHSITNLTSDYSRHYFDEVFK